MIVTKCQLCNSKDLKLVIDLGYHPLADTFLKAEQLTEPEETFPLRVLLCQNCGYATLQYVVEPEKRYQQADYSYTSSNSPVAIKHFAEMADQVITRANLKESDLVVDIGSNDGTLLASFKNKLNCQLVGVEPAANIAKIAAKNKIPTIDRFFGDEAVKQILKTSGLAKAITATNVFNHITDLNDFFKNINRLLHPDGFFMFESPYLLDLVEKNCFDSIYLEHVSYFGIKPLRDFLKKFGLYIHYIEQNDYMSWSIRVYIGKKPTNDSLVEKFCRREQKAKIYQANTYKALMSKVEKLKFNLCRQLYQIKARGEKIIGIGAATKGNTLLNYCRIDNSLIDFITDSSPLKINKFMPGSHIPIKSDADITPDIKYALILPWNIAAFLKKKLKHLNLKFIIPQIK
jgi:SAM-dependent methyltransferase